MPRRKHIRRDAKAHHPGQKARCPTCRVRKDLYEDLEAAKDAVRSSWEERGISAYAYPCGRNWHISGRHKHWRPGGWAIPDEQVELA